MSYNLSIVVARHRVFRCRGGYTLAAVLILCNCGGGGGGTPTSPSGSGSSASSNSQGVCGYRVAQSQLTQSMGYEGGALTIAVSVTDASCSWTSESQAGFITIGAGAGPNRGNGQAQLSVERNDGAERSGMVVIAGVSFVVKQTSPPCQFRVTAPATRFTDAGGTGTATIAVTQGVNCSWTAASEAAFLTDLTPASGTGNGTVRFTVARNTESAGRSGIVRIAGEALTINQDGVLPCAFSVTSNTTAFGVAGGNGSINVTVTQGSNCSWTASSEAPFVSNVAPGSGTGNGMVSFSVDRNTGTSARSGAVRVAGQAISVTQDGVVNCTYSSRFGSTVNVDAAGVFINATDVVPSDPSCSWTLVSSASWITIDNPGPRTGNGAYSFTVAPNTGPARVGNINIGNTRMWTINQAAYTGPVVCAYSYVDPVNVAASASFTISGVSTTPGCTWAPASTVPWITIEDPGQRTGNGIFRFRYERNPGPPRVGYIIIGNGRMTVNQAGQ